MKEASRTINIIVSELPDYVKEEDIKFTVDTSQLLIAVSIIGKDGTRQYVPRNKVDIDVEEGVYLRDI